jgi:hypothetical protein
MLKLRSTFQATRAALQDLHREIGAFLDKILVDTTVLDRLDGLLQTRREQMLRQVKTLVREVENAYDETSRERAQLLQRNLSWWRSFSLLWSRSAGKQELHSSLEQNLRQLMQPQMDKAARTLEADLRSLWPQMQDLLENQLSPDLQKEARQSVPDFASQRRELSETIQAAFIDILAGKDLQDQIARSYSQTALSLRIVIAVTVISGTAGALLLSKNAFFGTIAFAMAGLGVLIAILLAFNHRRMVRRVYEGVLSPKRAEFSKNLEEQFAKAIDSFCAEMGKKFHDLRELLMTRRRRYEPWSQQAQELQTTLDELKPRLG